MSDEKKTGSFDGLVQNILEENQKKLDEMAKGKVKYDFDKLTVYWNSEYKLTDHLTIRQPTIREIAEMGEDRYWAMVAQFCSNTTSFRYPLWQIGIDWTKISDFELFAMLVQSMEKDSTKLIFGPDVDFTQFRRLDLSEEEFILINMEDPSIIIDEETYLKMAAYLRMMFNYYPKEERKKMSKAVKQSIINIDLQEQQRRQRERLLKGQDDSNFLSLISFALNHPGFKYKKDELGTVGVFEFMDAIKRLENTENTRALMSGVYSGMLDTSSIKDLDKRLDMTRDL